MRSQVETITPDIAKKLLGNGIANRRLVRGRVAYFQSDMKAGNWALTGEPVIISDRGQLLDGQHRLHACVGAMVPFRTLVLRGISSGAFDYMGMGFRRNATDVLRRHGHVDASCLAAALSWKWRYERDPKRFADYNTVPTVHEIVVLCKKWSDMSAGVTLARQVKRFLSHSAMAFLVHEFRSIDPEIASWFVSVLATGENVGRSDAIYHLRERLLRLPDRRYGALGKKERIALIIKAWNFTVLGRPCRGVRWNTTGPRKEEFPEILRDTSSYVMIAGAE